MHAGEDVICAKEGSEEFYKKVGSKDSSLKIYHHFYHELFNEYGKERVFQDMEKWLNKQLKKKTSSESSQGSNRRIRLKKAAKVKSFTIFSVYSPV